VAPNQNGDGDTFVAKVEVAVGAKFRAAFDGITGILLKDTSFFPQNDTGDETFLRAALEELAQSAAKCTSFPGATVAVNDFDGHYGGLLGVANFGQELLVSLLDGGQLRSNIESFE